MSANLRTNTAGKLLLIAGLGLCIAFPNALQSAVRTKAATGTELTAAASWDTLPTTSDTAAWTSTGPSLGGALTLGSAQTWGAIDVEGADAPLSISGAGALTLSGGQTINGQTTSGFYINTGGQDVTIANNIALGAGQIWTVKPSRTLTLNGVISGAQTLGYYGGGTFIIGGINSASGNLTIDAATVHVNSGATLFCNGLGWTGRTVTLQNGGVLEAYNYANGSGNLWGECGDGAANIIFGTSGGTFKMLGATMNGTVNKGFTVNSGVTGHFYVPTGTTTTWSGTSSGRDFYVNGGTLDFNGGGSLTTSRYIRGTGTVTKSDAGTLTLSTAETSTDNFSGALIINGGTLVASASTSSGNYSATGNGGSGNTITVNNGATLQYTGSRGSGYHSANCFINGGTVTFNNTDMSWCSGKTLNFDTAAGTVNGTGQWRRRDAGNKVAVTVAASGSTISVADLNLLDNNPVFDVADGAQDADLTISSGITGSSGLVKSGGAGKLVLTGTSTYSGAVTVSAGTLQLGNGGANGSIGAGNITDNAALVFNRSGTFSVANNISGTGTLTVSGTGTMTYTGTASQSGATTVSGGTLLVNGALSGSSSTVAVSSGATLGGTGTIAGATTMDGTLSPGAASIGTLTINNTLTINSGATVAMEISKSGTTLSADKIAGTGTATINSGTLTVTQSGDALAHGDAFDLCDKTLGGTGFTTVNLPPLTSPLLWDTTQLAVNGTIRVYNPNTVSLPTFSPAAGGYVGAQSVTITSDEGSTIYYTTDGSEPTTSSANGPSPVSGIVVATDANITVKAFATKSGFTDSPVATAVFHTVTTPTWTADAAGSWTDGSKWQNTVVGAGADVTVDFSTVNLTAGRTVTLDGARTIGGLKFGDTTPDFNWTLNTGSGGPLTLDVTSGSPMVQVVNQTVTIGAVLAGTDGLTKTGNGTLVLNAANTYSGGTTLSAGTLTVANNSALGGAVTLNGGTLAFPGNGNSYSIANSVTVTAGSTARISAAGTYASTYPTLTLTAKVINNGSLTLEGGSIASAHDQLQITGGYEGTAPLLIGHVRLLTTACKWNANSTITLSGANDRLELRSTSEVMPSDTTVTVNNGNFMLNGVTTLMIQTIKALDGSGGTVTCDWGANTLKIGANDGSGSYSGTVANGGGTAPALSIVKIGAGTQILAGENTYTGPTVVSNGTLLVNGSLASGSVVTVSSDATLGGTGTVGGVVTVQAGGTLAPGTLIGTLTLGSSPVLNGTTLMEVDGSTCDKLSVGANGLNLGGTLKVVISGTAPTGGEVYQLFTAGSFSGSFETLDLPTLADGLSWWTGLLASEGKLVVNRAPTGVADHSYSRTKGLSLKFPKAVLMDGVSDPDDGDSASFDAVVYAGSATVTENDTWVFYAPANDNDDTISFRVKDTRGGTVTKNISITVVAAAGDARSVTVSEGKATLNCAGIPGYAYKVQRSENLVDWVDLEDSFINAPANGVWQYVDSNPPPISAYYRTAQQ